MPNWGELLEELRATGGSHDVLRRRYLAKLHEHTKRNTIIYYSGWLQKGELRAQGVRFDLNDGDKNGFMATINKLDRSLGLDLVLHTPGGDIAATESIVDYLRSMFDGNIRAIVPQLAMSAGTMIALSCREIIMGKHSSLGPIDPQVGGVAAHGLIEEVEHVKKEVTKAPHLAPLYQMTFAKYGPTLIGEAQKAIAWSETVVLKWLESGMFKGDGEAKAKAKKIVDELGSHALTLSHARHISKEMADGLGVKVVALEADAVLQDLVLSVHHACIQTLSATSATKIIENHRGTALIEVRQQFIPVG